MPRRPDLPCAICGTLMWRGKGVLPPGQATCMTCRRARRPAPRPCEVCGTEFVSHYMSRKGAWTRTCGTACGHKLQRALRVARLGPDHATTQRERAKARARAKTHHRRTVNRYTDITPEIEQAMRRKAKRCPMPGCGARLTDAPYLPNSKELDHIIPLNPTVGGTHTVGNARIICRACNLARPKDGRDYTGPVTLWAQMPGFIRSAA